MEGRLELAPWNNGKGIDAGGIDWAGSELCMGGIRFGQSCGVKPG